MGAVASVPHHRGLSRHGGGQMEKHLEANGEAAATPCLMRRGRPRARNAVGAARQRTVSLELTDARFGGDIAERQVRISIKNLAAPQLAGQKQRTGADHGLATAAWLAV